MHNVFVLCGFSHPAVSTPCVYQATVHFLQYAVLWKRNQVTVVMVEDWKNPLSPGRLFPDVANEAYQSYIHAACRGDYRVTFLPVVEGNVATPTSMFYKQFMSYCLEQAAPEEPDRTDLAEERAQ